MSTDLYTTITTVETSEGAETYTRTDMLEGDVQAHKATWAFVATTGDTILHQVIRQA